MNQSKLLFLITVYFAVSSAVYFLDIVVDIELSQVNIQHIDLIHTHSHAIDEVYSLRFQVFRVLYVIKTYLYLCYKDLLVSPQSRKA